MIVYGDPAYQTTLGALCGTLQQRIAGVINAIHSVSLDEWRTLLILAGQLEQAAHDALGDAHPIIQPLHALTGWAAMEFVRAMTPPQASDLDPQPALPNVDALTPDLSALVVTVKLPEGFALYALYPEQYALAAKRWLAAHSGAQQRNALVVGIRSIGTTLAAVVTAVLRLANWQVHSLTVRPCGHPFARQVTLPLDSIEAATWALIVDEGPGMSGSSFVAVAEALTSVGAQPGRISFLPGHSGEPGSAASETIRGWWRTTPRYVGALEDVDFAGTGLTQALAVASVPWCAAAVAAISVADWSGGWWRADLYAHERDWPAACVPFERPKFRCSGPGGGGVVWKFAGLPHEAGGTSVQTMINAVNQRAHHGYGPVVLGAAHGFVATPWIEGTPLTRADASTAILQHIGRYIAVVAGPPLTPDEAHAARVRLDEMLYWNVWELCGEALANTAREWSAQILFSPSGRRYGDGHLAPYEWRRTTSGHLLKTDSTGHSSDHTIVGVQSVAWDVAGAIIEWGLDATQSNLILAAFTGAGGEYVAPISLRYYCLAYAAFRAGQTHLCAAIVGAGAEQQRLTRASSDYQRTMIALISSLDDQV